MYFSAFFHVFICFYFPALRMRRTARRWKEIQKETKRKYAKGAKNLKEPRKVQIYLLRKIDEEMQNDKKERKEHEKNANVCRKDAKPARFSFGP